jgi:hypothetical protein
MLYCETALCIPFDSLRCYRFRLPFLYWFPPKHVSWSGGPVSNSLLPFRFQDGDPE